MSNASDTEQRRVLVRAELSLNGNGLLKGVSLTYRLESHEEYQERNLYAL